MNTVKISVCVSPEERQVIKAQAAVAGLSLSQYMGTIALCSRLDHSSVIQSLYLKAGEAHTLAHLVLTKYGNPSENSVEDINADFADLIQVIAKWSCKINYIFLSESFEHFFDICGQFI